MSRNTFFVQPCGTCGRPLKILVKDLGAQVCCQHCGSKFCARDHENESAAMLDPVSHWIGLADEILSNNQPNMVPETGEFSESYPRAPK